MSGADQRDISAAQPVDLELVRRFVVVMAKRSFPQSPSEPGQFGRGNRAATWPPA